MNKDEITLGQEAVHSELGVGRITAVKMLKIETSTFSSVHTNVSLLDNYEVGFTPYAVDLKRVDDRLITEGYSTQHIVSIAELQTWPRQ